MIDVLHISFFEPLKVAQELGSIFTFYDVKVKPFVQNQHLLSGRAALEPGSLTPEFPFSPSFTAIFMENEQVTGSDLPLVCRNTTVERGSLLARCIK